MNYHFCTYFDHNYLTRGLALYQSLEEHCPNFVLWVLPTSKQAAFILKKLQLPNMRLIRLEDFEDPALLRVKPDRTPVEYMWTMTPSLPLYILQKNPRLTMVAYIDADCYFFENPAPIYKELSKQSILLIEHRYSSDRKSWEATSGRFNVQLMIFRRDINGLKALRWWRARCLEWCYNRHEDGKLGDQMYLNDWPTRFRGVHILKHIGAGLAPWNIQNYTLTKRDNRILINDTPLVFYHFHALRLYSFKHYEPSSGYTFSSEQRALIYEPYIATLRAAYEHIQTVNPSFKAGFTTQPPLLTRLRGLASRLIRRFL